MAVDESDSGGRSRAMPAWVGPLVSTVTIQTTQSFTSRLVPTVAPVLTAAMGLPTESIGAMQALSMAGSILFLTVGMPYIRRFGPIRALQGGLLFCGAGLALLVVPLVPVIALANILMGVGYGPAAPAGSDILLRHAPPAHRTLIFSLKQAGVPVGGVCAGLILPWMVGLMDWRIAVLLLACIPLVTILLVQPIRPTVDADRNRSEPIKASVLLSPANLFGPLRAVLARPEMRGLTFSAGAFAVGQGSLLAFAVTWMVSRLNYDLTTAGFVFAVTQATGVIGRIALGWVADRTSGLSTLLVNAVAGAATMGAFAMVTEATSFTAVVALAAVSGITVTSWNGVQLAEVARLSPPGRVGETTSGATVVTFLGYIVGPAGFAALLTLTGSYPLAFAAVALVLCGAFAAVLRAIRAG